MMREHEPQARPPATWKPLPPLRIRRLVGFGFARLYLLIRSPPSPPPLMSGTLTLLREFTPTAEYPARRADAVGDLYPDAKLAPNSIYAASVTASPTPLAYHSTTVLKITCGGGQMNWPDYTFVDYSLTIPLYFTTGSAEGQFQCVFAFQQRNAGQQDPRFTAASIPPNFSFTIGNPSPPPPPLPPPPSPPLDPPASPVTESDSTSVSGALVAVTVVPIVVVFALIVFVLCRRRAAKRKAMQRVLEQPMQQHAQRDDWMHAPPDLAEHAHPPVATAVPVAWASAPGGPLLGPPAHYNPVYHPSVPLVYASLAAPAVLADDGHAPFGSGEEVAHREGDPTGLDIDAPPPYSEHHENA